LLSEGKGIRSSKEEIADKERELGRRLLRRTTKAVDHEGDSVRVGKKGGLTKRMKTAYSGLSTRKNNW